MQKTPLYQWHLDHGANMAAFGSFSMPLWYPRGARDEHQAVIRHCGIFDTSHMAAVLVRGTGAHELLQRTFSKDLDACLPSARPLPAGRCVYGVFLNDQGHVIDDAIVYNLAGADSGYMVVVNAGMGAFLAGHLRAALREEVVEIIDLSGKIGKIDVQGPASARLLGALLANPERVLQDLSYFSFKGWFESVAEGDAVELRDGTPLLLSRTGYTGEFGFELFLSPERIEPTWTALLTSGAGTVLPCGLAARDSLRAGAVLPLSHQDIGDWPFLRNPWQFALPYDDRGTFTKSFLGSAALVAARDAPYTYAFAGYDPRKTPADPDGRVEDEGGERLGAILTCTTDMAIDRVDGRIVSLATPRESGRPDDFRPRGLSCGFVRVDRRLSVGEKVFLAAGKRRLEVEIRTDIRPDRTARRPLNEMTE